MYEHEFLAVFKWVFLMVTEVYLALFGYHVSIALPILGGAICIWEITDTVYDVIRRIHKRRSDYVVGYDGSRKRA